ncbi:MAG: outer membrane protein assembly factor BamD [Myxococcota bacterium]
MPVPIACLKGPTNVSKRSFYRSDPVRSFGQMACRRPKTASSDSSVAVVPRHASKWVLFGLILAAGMAVSCKEKAPLFVDVPPAEELYEQGLEILKGRRVYYIFPTVEYDEAIETFQTIIDNYPYHELAVQAELRIADTYFEDERYDEALSYYRSFSDLHPQHELVPYTVLRAALCHYKQIHSINRDQTATREAQIYLEKLIREHPYAEETREGETLLRELRTRLSRHMMEMGDFYLKRDEFQSAAERYRTVLNVYPGLGLDAEGLFKLGVCYENMMRKDEARRLFHVVVANYPKSDIADEASERIAASN